MRSNIIYILLFSVFLILTKIGLSQGHNNCASASLMVVPNGGQITGTVVLNTSSTATATAPTPTNITNSVLSDNSVFSGGAVCKDAWFQFRAPSSGAVVIYVDTLSGEEWDLAAAVYAGSCGALTYIAGDDDGNGNYSPYLSVSCLTPGATYYVRAWVTGCYTSFLPSEIEATILDGGANHVTYNPPGNTLANAINITPSGTQIFNGVEVLETWFAQYFYPIEPLFAHSHGIGPTTNLCTDAGYNFKSGCEDIWYSVTLPAYTTMNIEVTDNIYSEHLNMLVYSGSCGSLVEEYCVSNSLLPTINNIYSNTTETYYIRFYDYNCDYDMDFDFTATFVSNDQPCGAQTLNFGASATSGSLLNANPSTVDAPNCGQFLTGETCNEVWYQVSTSLVQSGQATIHFSNINNLFGGGSSISAAVYSGSCNGVLNKIECEADAQSNDIDFFMPANSTYYIRVYDYNCDDVKTFDIEASFLTLVPNDNCSGASPINGTTSITSSLVGATQSPAPYPPTCYYTTGNICEDVWFELQFSETGTYVVDLEYISGANTNMGLALYTGTCPSSLTYVTCDEANSANISRNSRPYLIVGGTTGQSKLIRVWDRSCNDLQDFNINAEWIPTPNDECFSVTEIADGETIRTSTASVTQSGTTPFPSCNWAGSGCADAWFSYTFEADGWVNIRTDYVISDANTTSNIQAYTGLCGSLTSIGCYSAGAGTTLTGNLSGYKNETIYFRVYDYNCGDNRVFDISANFIATTLPNNTPCDAINIDEQTIINHETDNASTQLPSLSGTPNGTGCGFNTLTTCQDLWYSATVPTSGAFEVQISETGGSSFDVAMALYRYTGGSDACIDPNNLSEIAGACTSTSTTSSVVVGAPVVSAGETIYLRVYDYNCDGPKTFNLQLNDAVVTETDIRVDNTPSHQVDMVCGVTYDIYDSGGSDAAPTSGLDGLTGSYSANEDNTLTLCAPLGKVIRLEEEYFNAYPGRTNGFGGSVIHARQNDYLRIYDGNSTSDNLLRVVTGSYAASGRIGTIVSTGQCLTLNFNTGANYESPGFHFKASCDDAVAPNTIEVEQGKSELYTDSGGPLGDYGSDEISITTYCPDESASSSGEVIHAIMGSLSLETLHDIIYVFDGNSVAAPLLGFFSGSSTFGGVNELGKIRASAPPRNTSGCLTFMFVSDGSVQEAGWSASIVTDSTIASNGGEDCASALDISNTNTYQMNNMIATGEPFNIDIDGSGSADPNMNIWGCNPDTNDINNNITQLEASLWYKFNTTSVVDCGTRTIFEIIINNVSCNESSFTGGISTSGAQIALYQAPSCVGETTSQATSGNTLPNGSDWEMAKVECWDNVRNGEEINVTGLIPNTTYYLLFDAFAGRPCNLDIVVKQINEDYDNDGLCDGIDPETPLPVELISFTASLEGSNAILNWITASEINSDYFEIERSLDGINFESISMIDGAGNSNHQISYSDIDYNVDLLGVSVFYYRLKQTDFDGSYSYSQIVPLVYSTNEDFLNIYPNPVSNQTNIQINTNESGILKFVLYSSTGREVLRKEVFIDKGYSIQNLDLSALSTGIYYVHFELPNKNSLHKSISVVR